MYYLRPLPKVLLLIASAKSAGSCVSGCASGCVALTLYNRHILCLALVPLAVSYKLLRCRRPLREFPLLLLLQVQDVTGSDNTVLYSPPVESCSVQQHNVNVLLQVGRRSWIWWAAFTWAASTTWTRTCGCPPRSGPAPSGE